MKLASTVSLYAQRSLDGRRMFRGLNISIENGVGSVRRGAGPDGKPWATRFKVPYGYIRRTEGIDGDHVDVFLGPNEQANNVYVIHQKNPVTGGYDEDKCMVGFDSAEAAKAIYLQHYDRPERFFGGMEAIPFEEFKAKVLTTKERPQKIAAEGL